ncbi:transmembrane protein 214-A-like [Macrosteles quadrilineatus]|uniref:transmembrane protein 214-A-like n=1 Tax=Macrosteles quadrilineatus TaxID=74068 RepID=UPI0023E1D78A|nr:transmembrane protein 214-A-like [Macrosteles quadrilineatus]
MSAIGKFLTYIVLATILGFIALDINEHGSFSASKTHRFLKDSGALHFGEVAWKTFRTYSQQGYRWCQSNVPVYAAKARDTTAPFLHAGFAWLSFVVQLLLVNVTLIYEFILSKKPLVEQWINQYAPGLMESASYWFWRGLAIFGDIFILVFEFVLTYLSLAVTWLMENVFVGSLSPENLQKYTMDALNATSRFAAETLYWLTAPS